MTGTLPIRLSFHERCLCLMLEWNAARRARGERTNSKMRRHLRRKAGRVVAKAMLRVGSNEEESNQ